MDIKELKVNAHNQNHPWEYARYKVIASLLHPYIKSIKNPQSIIDVGCGDIFFLNRFNKQFSQFKPIAVDIAFNENIIQQLRAKYSNPEVSFFTSIYDIPTDSGKADFVFIMDVIEHIEKDSEFLFDLKSQNYIDKNTLFIITVPAFNKLYFSHDKWIGHYRRYTKKTLQNTIQNAGLESIENGYFFFSLLFPRLIQKVIEHFYPKKEEDLHGAGDWHGGKLVTWIYKSILIFDFKISRLLRHLGLTIPGLSTYAICKIKNSN